MRSIMIILVAAGLVALVNSLPFVQNENYKSSTLDQLAMVDDNDETTHRSKRTIGILRQLFPDISKMIEKKVNMIVAEVIRVLGPTVIQSVLGGARENAGGRKPNDENGSTVTIAIPTEDEDDDDEDDNNNKSDTDNIKSENNNKVSIPLPTVSPDDENESSVSTTSTISTNSVQFSPSDGAASEERISRGIFGTPGHERRSFRKQRSPGGIRGHSTSSKRSSGIRIDTVGRYRSERRGEQEQKISQSWRK